MLDAAVVNWLLWQAAHPTSVNRASPAMIDGSPPGELACAGGLRRRMNMANITESLDVARAVLLKFVWSSGVVFTLHYAASPLTRPSSGVGRSCVNSSLLTPISTL